MFPYFVKLQTCSILVPFIAFAHLAEKINFCSLLKLFAHKLEVVNLPNQPIVKTLQNMAVVFKEKAKYLIKTNVLVFLC